MTFDLFKDLKALLSSPTLPDRAEVDRILSAYSVGTITIDEAIAEIAKWFEAQKSLLD